MGTLFNQPERKKCLVQPEDVSIDVWTLKEIAEEEGVSLADVIAVRAILEQERANNLRVANYDALDEQLAGFGELLRELIEALRDLRA